MKTPKNTLYDGSLNFMVYRETASKKGSPLYTAVCLELDLVEQGDDPKELALSIELAAREHVEAIAQMGLSEKLLNRHAPKPYWDKFYAGLAEYMKAVAQHQVSKVSATPNVQKVWSTSRQELTC